MRLIRCDISFSDQIRAILNDAILNSTALYDYHPWTPEMMTAWFEVKEKGNYPVIGLVTETGELAGFGSYGVFRSRPAYKYTVEHSLYVAQPFRGRGLGMLILQEIISAARAQGYHVLVGGIDADNAASIRLHEKLGFVHAGTLKQVGYKFDRWLNLAFYQLVLDTPANPVAG